MAGYTRQSSADIIATAVVRANPLNVEYNALRDAFNASTGHKHDGTAAEGAYVPLIADSDALNKVVIDTSNNRIGVFVEVSSAAVEQIRIQDGAVVPVTTNDIDLGTSSLQFKDLFIDGTANIDSLVADTADINAGTIDGVTIGGSSAGAGTFTALTATGTSTLSTVDINGGAIDGTIIGASSAAASTFTTATTTGLATLATADINGGTIDGAVIGGSTPQAITGTLITANTNFAGNLTGNVTGNITGNVTGNITGDVTGDLTGNVTASSGTSTFNNVTVDGTLDVTGTTIANVTDPVNAQDAATKNYVDTADALKLNLSGGTMSGDITMGSNTVTGLAAPSATTDAATKGYVDTSVANLVDSAPGTLDTLNELAAALGDDPDFATTVTDSIATKLSLAGGTMTGDIVLGSNKATSTATPATDDTLTRKGYVDTQDALKLNLSGGTMSGAIAMGTSKITGLGDPTANQDAATKVYVDTADALKLNLSGGTLSGNLALGSNNITGLATPTANDHATNKSYVDGILGSATSAATSAAAAATSATDAASSATAAATSETNAASSATAAAASYDNFDDRYLGAKSSAPSTDNDGDALITGALYWNSSSNGMYAWTGSAWALATNYNDAAVDTHLNTSTAASGEFLSWNGSDYDWAVAGADLYAANPVSATDPTAAGTNAVAIGSSASAGGTDSFAASTSANASGFRAIAIGSNTTASSGLTVSIGYQANAGGSGIGGDTALGYNAVSAGQNAVALTNSYASGTDSFATAIANNTSSYGATGSNSVAIGQLSKATATNSIAIGDTATSTTANQIALGGTTDTVKISGAYTLPAADGTNGQVLTTDGSGAVTFADAGGGASAYTIDAKTSAYTVVAGDLGKIINCTSGTFTLTLTAAATLGAGFNVYLWNTGTGAITIDGNASETIDGATTYILRQNEGTEIVCDGSNFSTGAKKTMRGYAENIPSTYGKPVASGAGAIALGNRNGDAVYLSQAIGTRSFAVNGYATSNYSTAIGQNSTGGGAEAVTGAGAMALGGSSARGTASFAAAIDNNSSTYGAQGANSIAMGYLSKATGIGNVNIGYEGYATGGSGSVAIGYRARATGTNAICLGQSGYSTASGAQSLAIGYSASATATHSMAIGRSHTIQAQYATAIGGRNSEATSDAQYGIVSGYEAKIAQYGKGAHASGSFAASGDAQGGQFILRADTTDATATVLTTNNSTAASTNQIVAASDTCITFDGTITAMQNGAQAYASWKIEGLLVNDGGTTTLANSATTVISNGSSWGMALSADNTNNALAITCTGEASHNIRWVANIRTTEVTYA